MVGEKSEEEPLRRGRAATASVRESCGASVAWKRLVSSTSSESQEMPFWSRMRSHNACGRRRARSLRRSFALPMCAERSRRVRSQACTSCATRDTCRLTCRLMNACNRAAVNVARSTARASLVGVRLIDSSGTAAIAFALAFAPRRDRFDGSIGDSAEENLWQITDRSRGHDHADCTPRRFIWRHKGTVPYPRGAFSEVHELSDSRKSRPGSAHDEVRLIVIEQI